VRDLAQALSIQSFNRPHTVVLLALLGDLHHKRDRY
jgi:hypothetical protein